MNDLICSCSRALRRRRSSCFIGPGAPLQLPSKVLFWGLWGSSIPPTPSTGPGPKILKRQPQMSLQGSDKVPTRTLQGRYRRLGGLVLVTPQPGNWFFPGHVLPSPGRTGLPLCSSPLLSSALLCYARRRCLGKKTRSVLEFGKFHCCFSLVHFVTVFLVFKEEETTKIRILRRRRCLGKKPDQLSSFENLWLVLLLCDVFWRFL